MGQQEIYEYETPGEFRHDVGLYRWLTLFLPGLLMNLRKTLDGTSSS